MSFAGRVQATCQLADYGDVIASRLHILDITLAPTTAQYDLLNAINHRKICVVLCMFGIKG
jgi:hypothetical protein